MLRWLFRSLVLVIALSATACAPAASTPPPPAPYQPTVNTAQDDKAAAQVVADVVAQLRRAGVEATLSAPPSSGGSFFDAPEWMLDARGAFIRVFVFSNPQAAAQAAGVVRPDGVRPGGTGGTAMGTVSSPRYVAPAHFFRSGSTILVYLAASSDVAAGQSERVLGGLRKAFGPEFAKSAQ